MSYRYKYPRPAVSADCVVFGLDADNLKVLLIQRRKSPFQGVWALPGGFVEIDEDLDSAARRELKEETGLSKVYLEQLYTFGQVERDPRGRVITVAYFALVNLARHTVRAASDASRAVWFSMSDLPALAFDHEEILSVGYQRLKNKVRYQPIGFELLPAKFTLRQLQQMYEIILGRELDKRNFRRKILSMGILVELDQFESNVARRAARLFRFDRRAYRRLTKHGFNFEI